MYCIWNYKKRIKEVLSVRATRNPNPTPNKKNIFLLSLPDSIFNWIQLNTCLSLLSGQPLSLASWWRTVSGIAYWEPRRKPGETVAFPRNNHHSFFFFSWGLKGRKSIWVTSQLKLPVSSCCTARLWGGGHQFAVPKSDFQEDGPLGWILPSVSWCAI